MQTRYVYLSFQESIQQANKSGGLFPIAIGYNNSPTEISDGYTDSDSESDNTSNVERWLESLPANDAWSSTPNYLALDGSEGLEGVDEIQEDSKKPINDDSGTRPTGTNDSRISLTSMTKDSEVKIDGNNHAKRTYAKQEKVFAIDRRTPHKKMERTLKMRQKIPLWTEVERKAKIVIAKEKFLDKEASEEADTNSSRLPERNFSGLHEKAVCSSSKITQSGRSGREPSFQEDAYKEMMQEMVHGLLNESACSGGESTRYRTIERPRKETLSKLCEINESKETIEGSPLQLGMKRARLNSTYKNLSPKSAKTKINENHLSKRRKRMPSLETVTKTQEPNSQDIQPGKTINRPKCFPQSRTVRFQDEIKVGTSTETWRQAAMATAARNKQILQTVKEIVDHIGGKDEERSCGDPGEAQRMLNAVSELEGCKDLVELNICRGLFTGNRKRLINSIENNTIESRKPTFTNPFIEDCLDKAMEEALGKYKCPPNTWEDFVKEKKREMMCTAGYEPPAKKSKPKSLPPKVENVPRQDFSRLNSWQSIHSYFLLHSSCK